MNLISGELSWTGKLNAKEVFSRSLTIEVGKNIAVSEITLKVIGKQGTETIGKTDRLFFRQVEYGMIEFSHDYYFGGVPGTPNSIMGVAATPGSRSSTEPLSLPKPYGQTQIITPTITLTPTLAIIRTHTQTPQAYP